MTVKELKTALDWFFDNRDIVVVDDSSAFYDIECVKVEKMNDKTICRIDIRKANE